MAEKIRLRYRGNSLVIAADYRKGAGETILFIHGLGCSKDSFRYVWDLPQYEKFTILAFDLPGFGSSSKPEGLSYTIEEHAEICQLVVEKLNNERINLVGHSMGGAIGLLLIQRIPSRVVSFTSLEGNLIGEDCTLSRQAIRYSGEDFEKGGFAALKSGVRDTKDLLRSAGVSGELLSGWLDKSVPGAFYRSSKSLVEWSDSGRLLPMFTGLAIKKCYVFGERNKDLPVIGMLGDVPRIQITGSGHFMMLANPRQFYRKLYRFLWGE